jgi:hypothetical protein
MHRVQPLGESHIAGEEGGCAFMSRFADAARIVARQARSNHPLVQRLKQLRKRHKKSLIDVEVCMGLPIGTLRLIEEGHRPLPPLIGRDGENFGEWYQRWLACVMPTDDEREEFDTLLMVVVLGRFKNEMDT